MFRNGFPLEQCTAITNALLKVINKCYWTSSNTDDGCMSGEENELADASLKALTVSVISDLIRCFNPASIRFGAIFRRY